MVTFTLRLLYRPLYQFTNRLAGPHSQCGSSGEENNLHGYAGNRNTIPRLSIQWLSHCTDYVSLFPCNVRSLSCNRQPLARSAHQLRYCRKILAI